MPADEPERRAGEDDPHELGVARAEPAGLEQQRDDRPADRDERDRRRHDEEHDAAERAARAAAGGARARASASPPVALDISGSSAAEIAMPNRLTGSRYSVCALNIAATIASPRKLASDLIDVAPRAAPSRGRTAPARTRAASRARPVARRASDGRRRRGAGGSPSAAGPGTAPRSRSPRPTRASTATSSSWPASRRPAAIAAPISAAFHSTGDTYDRKNRRWLLSTPRHHADITSSAMPGNRIWTSWTVSVARRRRRSRARADRRADRRRPRRASAIALATSASSVPIARATRDASSVPALGEQPRVDRDERRREHALAEQVLQQVRDAQRGAERVGGRRQAEVVRDARARARGPRSATGRCRRRPPARRRRGHAVGSVRGTARARGDSRRARGPRQAGGGLLRERAEGWCDSRGGLSSGPWHSS